MPRQCDSIITATSTSWTSSTSTRPSPARARSSSASRRPASTPARPRSGRARCTSAGRRPSRPARAATSRASSPRSGRASTACRVGDEVIGYTDERASHAELVAVDAEHLTPRPAAVPWEVAGSLYVVGATAYAAVRAVGLREGDVVVVSGAAGGVGTLVVQLARDAGATVVGLASEDHHDWLREHGALPVTYGDGVAERIREAARRPGRRVHRPLRLRLRRARPRARRRARAHRHDRGPHGARAPPGRQDRRQHGGREPRDAGRARRAHRRGPAGGPDRPRLPAGRGARGLHRARAPPHAAARSCCGRDMTGT